MESVLKMIQQVVVNKEVESSAEMQKKNQILDELKEVSRQMACNELWFELECDENLIEACIFQRESLKARYRYLLGQAKCNGVTRTPELKKQMEG